jgi:hypothetical protein
MIGREYVLNNIFVICTSIFYLAFHKGEMQEWFNWHAWKACVPREAGPGVRIPLSPQKQIAPAAQLRDFCFWSFPDAV